MDTFVQILIFFRPLYKGILTFVRVQRFVQRLWQFMEGVGKSTFVQCTKVCAKPREFIYLCTMYKVYIYGGVQRYGFN